MAFFSDSIIYNIFVLVVILFICLYLYFTSTFNYWRSHGLPYVQPLPFFGNVKDQLLLTKHLCEVYHTLYERLHGCKYGGVFLTRAPALLVRDPEVVERILVRDFNHFTNRGFLSNLEYDKLNTNLFNLDGERWHALRLQLAPTFTTARLKGMFDQICKGGDELVKQIDELNKTGKDIDSYEILTNFALDVIASCAFGLQADCQTEESEMFRKMVAKAMDTSKMQMFRIIFLMYAPKIAKQLQIRAFPKESEEFFTKLVKDAMAYREQNRVQRHDFLQLLMNLRRQESGGKVQQTKEGKHQQEDDVKHKEENSTNNANKVLITESVIAAQAFVFLSAGSESISSTLGFCLYCLAQNPDVQSKVHDEVDSILERTSKDWSFQTVKEMTYLDLVIQETLRMYPVATTLFRVCTKPYNLPYSTYKMPEGMKIVIPVMSIHNDPDNYRSPEVFNPNRFINNKFKSSGIYMPFGDGPRICIGMKFAILELKVVLARILSEYTVKLSNRTKLPFKYDPLRFFLRPESGFWFKFEKRLTL